MTISKNFSHLFCNPIELESYQKQIKAINKNYSNDLIEFLFIQNKEEYKNYLFSDSKHIEDTLRKNKEIKFIDNISTEYDFATNKYIPKFEIFENLNKIKLQIGDDELEKNGKRKEGWGIITIDMELPDEKEEKITYSLTSFEPFDIDIDDHSLNSFISLRNEHNLHDWINLLLYSLGYSSESLNFKEKITLIARSIPFCEKNFSLLEIGSRGTGKSDFYNIYKNNSVKIYSHKPTVADLFYDKKYKKNGTILQKDVIIIDEAHQMNFDDESSTMFKSYLANGTFDRGKESSSECSIVFLGNYKNLEESNNNPEQIITNLQNKFFCDPAILERISYISHGWEVPKYKDPIDSSREKLLPSYLIKILQKLKNESFDDFIEEKIEFHKDLAKRDKKNIIKTVSGLLKILHPNKIIRDKELIAYLSIASENEQYKLNLKQYIEDPNNTMKDKTKSEFKLPCPIFTPRNESYKNNIDVIKKEFILYNYIDLFKSNYSLKDFIPIGKEFELDNSNNTNISFFPITKIENEKKETLLVGEVLTIDHPFFKNEVLNIAISLTGVYQNEGKIIFYKKLNELSKSTQYTPPIKNTFEEIGPYSDNFLILSTKRDNSAVGFSTFFDSPELSDNDNIDIFTYIKSGFIPYYPKNIYSSSHFKYSNFHIHYGNFHLIEKLNNKININSINYRINNEKYDISYSEVTQPIQNNVMIIQQPPFNQQFPNNGGFGQNIQSIIPISQNPQPTFSYTEPIKKSLNINELIDLLEEKTSQN